MEEGQKGLGLRWAQKKIKQRLSAILSTEYAVLVSYFDLLDPGGTLLRSGGVSLWDVWCGSEAPFAHSAELGVPRHKNVGQFIRKMSCNVGQDGEMLSKEEAFGKGPQGAQECWLLFG